MADLGARGRNAVRRGEGAEGANSSNAGPAGHGANSKSSRQQEFAVDPLRDDFAPPVAMVTAIPIEDYYSTSAGISGSTKGGTYAVGGPTSGGSGGGGGGGGGSPKKSGKKDKDSKDKAPPMLFEQGRQSSVKWPKRLCDEVIASFSAPTNETAGSKFLSDNNWTRGMQSAFFASCKKIPIRFFIVDDSGSMVTQDGTRIIRTSKGSAPTAKMISCTRWSELTDALKFHAELSEICHTPSEFRLLNGADPVMVGLGNDNSEGLEFATEVLEEQPAGQTPLCHHVRCVVRAIEALAPTLRAQGKRAAVIIATDGESSDGNITDALRPLHSLPVWVVLRLCTNDIKVVDYWNNIDKELELEMDVIDDLVEDAEQVRKCNPWLVYGDELHRLREFGAAFKELDIIDESPLGSEQMQALLSVLFNCKLPHPDMDWSAFREVVQKHVSASHQVFNPLTGKYSAVIDMHQLDRCYGDDSGSGSGSGFGGSATCNVS